MMIRFSDLLIITTALSMGFKVWIVDLRGFQRIPGLSVVPFAQKIALCWYPSGPQFVARKESNPR